MATSRSDPAESTAKNGPARRTWPDWYGDLASFRESVRRKAIWQLVNTLVPYGGLGYLMVRSIQIGTTYALTLALALPAAAFLVRTFILFHDCVHGSLFRSKRANALFGRLLGVLVFTSFDDWRFTHLRHHATAGNLDARGFGDVWTLTVAEYLNASNRVRWLYRLYRNPAVMLGLGAVFSFALRNRIPSPGVTRKEWGGIVLTNLLIAGVFLAVAQAVGWQTILLVQVPVLWLAWAAGIWLFYVQHQFEGVYWARKAEWDPLRAAMEGSSYYRLPIVLRWFSGSIGYHHVHHLSPKIANYHLKSCYDAVPALRARRPLTVAKSPFCFRLKLWDEERQTMVAFP